MVSNSTLLANTQRLDQIIPKRIDNILYLRAIAVGMVLFAHFFNNGLLNDNRVSTIQIPNPGRAGVLLFFVISGFVLPYSFNIHKYTIKRFPVFLLKRTIRIELPYFATILLILLLSFPKLLLGQPINYAGGIKGVLLHFVYLNDLLGVPWLSDIFWTLALEFQFYIFIGIAFPLVQLLKREYASTAILCLLNLAVYIPVDNTFFEFMPFFIAGWATALFYLKKIKGLSYSVLIFSVALVNALTLEEPWLTHLIPSIFYIAVCILESKEMAVLRFLGNLSFSIYLLHALVVSRLWKIMEIYSINDTTHRIFISCAGLIFSILISIPFHRYIEKPAYARSKKIHYKTESPAQ